MNENTSEGSESKDSIIERLHIIIGQLLNHCDKEGGECSYCSKLICPHKDILHFHHDGCPSCDCDEMEEHSKISDPYKDMWDVSQIEIERLQAQVTELTTEIKANRISISSYTGEIKRLDDQLGICSVEIGRWRDKYGLLENKYDQMEDKVEMYKEIAEDISYDLTWASWLSSVSLKAKKEIKECISRLDALRTNGSLPSAKTGDFHPKIPAVPCEEVKEPSAVPDPSQTSDIEALRWMLERQAIVDTDMAHDPEHRYVVWAVDWTRIVSRIKLSEGSSEMEAVRKAMLAADYKKGES